MGHERFVFLIEPGRCNRVHEGFLLESSVQLVCYSLVSRHTRVLNLKYSNNKAVDFSLVTV
jgi:hypothetical protein